MFGFDLLEFLKYVGLVGLFAIIFAESGLLVGFFLPGDSLLFTAGFLASQGFFHISWLIILTFIAAVTGDSVGYSFGYRWGRKIFNRPHSLFFHPENLYRAEAFYKKHGGKAIILARFLPIVRTFVPIMAGVGSMKYVNFIIFNIIGGLLWAVGLPLAGYFLGNAIPNVDRYLLPIVLAIIVLSLLPTALHILRSPADRERLISAGKQLWQKITTSG